MENITWQDIFDSYEGEDLKGFQQFLIDSFEVPELLDDDGTSLFTAKLLLENYKPDQLEKGMWFLGKTSFDELFVYELDKIPYDDEKYTATNGFPVKPILVHEGNPNLKDDYVIAMADEIGWFDEGEHTDSLVLLDIHHVNRIIQNDGDVDVLVEPDFNEIGRVVPIMNEGKVILSYELIEYNGEYDVAPEDDRTDDHSWEDEEWQQTNN
jgi:hypothetical protein